MKRAPGLLAMVLASLFSMCLATGVALASVGVGITPGIIQVDEPLLPGGHYNLPSLQVMNTGTEAGDYEVVIARMGEQQELEPPAEYIVISPAQFHLEAGASQTVSLSLSIPAKARPGDYLAYIEAHPVAEAGGTSVGVAAAAKLYFTIRPSNVWVGVTNAVGDFFTSTAPASYIVLGVVLVGVAAFFLRRHIRVDIRIRRR
jgi:hypothetical protein